MRVMVTISYPTTSTMAVGKAAVESLKKPFEHGERISMHVTYGNGGLKAYSLYEFEKGYEDEASRQLFQNFVPFYDIEGFKLDMEIVVPVAEALPMIGLSL